MELVGVNVSDIIAGTIEAVGADITFRETDGVHDSFKAVELKSVDTNMLAYFLDHGGIFLGGAVAIGFEVAYFATFKLFDTAACDKLHIGFGSREIEEGASVDEGRTADADMDVLHSSFVEHLDLVAELSATNNGVIAEDHIFAFQHFAAGDEFHLGYEVA